MASNGGGSAQLQPARLVAAGAVALGRQALEEHPFSFGV